MQSQYTRVCKRCIDFANIPKQQHNNPQCHEKCMYIHVYSSRFTLKKPNYSN